ncbi:MAG: hypothetical protein ABIO72_04500 [Patescibacteria group bacterium]
MKERFAEQQPPSPILNGERVGISGAAFSKYVSALEEPGKKKSHLHLVVGEWKAPHGKVPATTEAYVTARKVGGETKLELHAMHPEELDEDTLGGLLSEAVPRAMDMKTSPKARLALEAVMVERRREQVVKEIQLRVVDTGIRYICEQLIKEAVKGETHMKLPGSEVHDAGIELLRSIKTALRDGSHLALPELQRTAEKFAALWQTLAPKERDHMRRNLAHLTA